MIRIFRRYVVKKSGHFWRNAVSGAVPRKTLEHTSWMRGTPTSTSRYQRTPTRQRT
jgi:hypothetical protein